MNLETQIGKYTFDNCLMNASGPKCTTKEELQQLLQGGNASYVSKSATTSYREGNPMPRYADLDLGSINSMGLPNQGLEFYLEYLEENQHLKTPFLSIAGLTLEENIEMLQKVESSNFRGLVELNLSCPNVPGKPQTGYDFQRTEQVLDEVFNVYTHALGVKLPPYFDMIHFEEMANILNRYPLSFVTCINSIGNALFVDVVSESVVIKPKEGFGGLGGEYVKPTALANVRKFYTLLNDSISIIGCGGVRKGTDVFEHLLCGASMVQVGTEFIKEDIKIFDRLIVELQSVMKKKGYENISEFKGKLRTL